MKNLPRTMKNHENRPGTINKQKRYKQTHRSFLLYIDYHFQLQLQLHIILLYDISLKYSLDVYFLHTGPLQRKRRVEEPVSVLREPPHPALPRQFPKQTEK